LDVRSDPAAQRDRHGGGQGAQAEGEVILTNRLGLPQSIVNAVSRDNYSRGDANISVTGLIGPARKRMLEIVHGNELTEDVTDRIWALFGQVTHGILERHDDEAKTEERLFIQRHGWRISGQFDRLVLETGTLGDYKVTSTYSIKDGAKAEWIAQANIYALMLREHGYTVNRLQIVVILRDHQRSKAQHDPDYPQAPVVVIDVPMWPAEQTEQYILDRLLAHANAQHVLPLCSPEERWERPAKFAVMKDGNKRATSLHDTREEAEREADAKSNGGRNWKYRVDERPAEQVRCRDYCICRPVCVQADELLKATRINFAA
jgi:hypothetical protein